MNSNVVFRSHLMQQFALAARNQSRPPIALSRTSLASSSSRRHQSTSTATLIPSTASSRYTTAEPQHRCFSSAAAAVIVEQPPLTPPTAAHEEKDTMVEERRSLNSTASIELDATTEVSEVTTVNEEEEESQSSNHGMTPTSITASSFQSLLLTRRTVSNFLPAVEHHPSILKAALDRAILCAQNAPNHKRTEPFLFKRLLSHSPIKDLADIAHHVTLFKQSQQRSEEEATALADRKRTKWSQIPAYVVALVEHQPNQEEEDDEDDDEDVLLYEQLPFVPPQTERQLEDYASASAAVQNLLLSLHAEQIGTKWATGPIIHTRAFRRLIHAKPTDRVAGLIMVGVESSASTSRRPRRRRRTMEELVQDF